MTKTRKPCVHMKGLSRYARKMVMEAGCDYCQEGRMEAEADQRFDEEKKDVPRFR